MFQFSINLKPTINSHACRLPQYLTKYHINPLRHAARPRKCINTNNNRHLFVCAAQKAKFNSFEEMIQQYDVVLVEFYATWCGPCHMMSQLMSEASATMKDVKFIKIDTEKNAKIAANFNISGLPTLMLFKNGKAIARQEGVVTDLQRWVESALSRHT